MWLQMVLAIVSILAVYSIQLYVMVKAKSPRSDYIVLTLLYLMVIAGTCLAVPQVPSPINEAIQVMGRILKPILGI